MEHYEGNKRTLDKSQSFWKRILIIFISVGGLHSHHGMPHGLLDKALTANDLRRAGIIRLLPAKTKEPRLRMKVIDFGKNTLRLRYLRRALT